MSYFTILTKTKRAKRSNHILVYLLFLITSTSCFCQSKENHKSYLKTNLDSVRSILSGKWVISCEKFSGYINIIDLDSIEVEVNLNQIYILSKLEIKQIHKDSIYLSLFLQKPLDLGRGGMQLNWAQFDKNTEIADLIFYRNDTIELMWKGFYNQKKLKREWQNQTDWSRSTFIYPFCLKKCP